MMGYSKDSKAYRLFDLIKQQIIFRKNVIFDEKSLGIKLWNSFFGLLHSDPFDIVPKYRLIVPFLGISTNLLTPLPKSTSSHSTTIKMVTSPH